ncbi:MULTISPECIES: DUF4266 domain-containing protein [Rufibacter]|uniref:DUF4266 domain-containing protein n=1 Tax=Rufibacter TaxID=1379908 RepID=UPI001B30B781|nr:MULTISPECIES: DUF4266 domain-containing protein [Rufibacter]
MTFLKSKILVLLVTGAGLASCQSVKEYNKMYLNDSEMVLSARKVQKTEMSFMQYREGASGANGGTSGGGCGCN